MEREGRIGRQERKGEKREKDWVMPVRGMDAPG